MARFEETNNLFGYGVGDSTDGEIICELCKKVYNKGIGVDEDKEDEDFGDTVRHTNFAGLQVCECCFEKIENSVLNRIDDILKWYSRIIKTEKERIQENEKLLSGVTE